MTDGTRMLLVGLFNELSNKMNSTQFLKYVDSMARAAYDLPYEALDEHQASATVRRVRLWDGKPFPTIYKEHLGRFEELTEEDRVFLKACGIEGQ